MLKLIKQTGVCAQVDDPSLPFKLEVNLRPPEFMVVTFVMMFGGSEEIVVRASTEGEIREFVNKNRIYGHPRLRRYTITGPDGVILEEKRI